MTALPTIPEPRLNVRDHEAWASWMRTCRIHQRTQGFRTVVDRARRVAGEALAKASKPSLGWSAGKDSTALTHLVVVGLGAGSTVRVFSEKDDLDFPGEEDYVTTWAARWGADLHILRPVVSPSAWLDEHAGTMSGSDDIHSRAAGLSKACFYPTVTAAEEGHDLSFLGIRAEESGDRLALRATRGLHYRLKSRPGLSRCIPLGDWRGIDVYAYLLLHDIDPLHVYTCIGWWDMTRREPWLIRKSWWVGGAHSIYGWVAWLRHYWPSLWAKYQRWFRDARSFV